MRALREIIGGLSLALLAVIVVISGLWLAVAETGSTQPTATTVAANTAISPTFQPLTQIGAPSVAASKNPTQPASAIPTFTHTAAFTSTFTATTTPTQIPTTAVTLTPIVTATLSPTLAPTQTSTLPATLCSPPTNWVAYIVAPGDTLFQLSLRFGISTAQLQAANCLPTTEIKFNQILYVPFLPSATPPVTATATVTATAVSNPLLINGINLIGVQADASRPNGAIAILFIDFSGGAAPYTVYNDNQPQAGNPIQVLTECGGTLLHTLRVLSADGQSVEYPYYYSPVVCP